MIIDWNNIYLFLTPFRTKCFEKLEFERLCPCLQKDKLLKDFYNDPYHKWKRFILDKRFSYSNEKYEESSMYPCWIPYSTQVLSMTYSHMFRRVQEENLHVLWRDHSFFFDRPKPIKLGVIWFQHRLWFIAENETNGNCFLLW